MAQQVLHARVQFMSTDAHTDNCSNDFYFEATGAGPDIDLDAVVSPTTAIQSFYNNTVSGQSAALGSYISPKMDRSTNGSLIAYYDVTTHLDGSPAGSPIRTVSWTLTTSTASSYLPPGCSACMGYRGDYDSDLEHVGNTRPRSRDRGRIYLGPLTSVANGGAGGLIVDPFKTDYLLQFNAIARLHNVGETNQFNLVQWSRRSARVKAVTFYALNEGISYTRLRADENVNRVHNWQPIT